MRFFIISKIRSHAQDKQLISFKNKMLIRTYRVSKFNSNCIGSNIYANVLVCEQFGIQLKTEKLKFKVISTCKYKKNREVKYFYVSLYKKG